MFKTSKKANFSIIMAALMAFIIVFNVVLSGSIALSNVGASASINQELNANNTFVKSDLNTDALREQYFNQNLVTKTDTVANYEGKRWVIVDLGEDTLFARFKKSGSRYEDFASYASSIEGQRAQADIVASQQNFIKKLELHKIDYDFKYSYSAVNNGLAVSVSADGFNAIRKMSEVAGVYYSDRYAVPKFEAVSNNANVYATGIYNSENLGYKGEGMKVAILDTGLDHTHEAFQTMPNDTNEGLWTKSDIEFKLENTPAGKAFKAKGSVDDFYYNSKVPFAYDYADDDPNVYPSYSSHGTHVAGIVAGSSDYVVNKETGEKFVGVAPEAQLVICKVFTDDFDNEALGGANTVDILAALNDCTLLGVDVINMSLGTSAGFTDMTDTELESKKVLMSTYNAIREAGISLVCAASNDFSSGYGGGNGTNLASNPDSSTVGAPSTYEAAISVASINGQLAKYVYANDDENQVAFITPSSNEYGVEFEFIDQLYAIAAQSRNTTIEALKTADPETGKYPNLKFKYVVIGGVGRETNYTNTAKNELNHANAVKQGYDGTIALIKRGDTTFAEKVSAAKTGGADACIIYNNVAGTIRMSLGEVKNPIPACSITMDAGKTWVSNAKQSKGSVTINFKLEAGPFMSDFSSWGPNPDLKLKPEITAHGGEIISAVPGGYDKFSGTSMAAPNMAGAVALLRQYLKTAYPSLSDDELTARVFQVLMSTATIARNEEGNPYSPRKQGAGLAGIADAIASEGYITTSDSSGVMDKTKIELGADPFRRGQYTLNFLVHNITDSTQTYDAKTFVMTETISSDNKTVAEKSYQLTDLCDIVYETSLDGVNYVPCDGTIAIAGKGANAENTVFVRIKITLKQAAKNYLNKNFTNGMYVEGFVSLVANKGAGTNVTLGVPYLAFYGDWAAAPIFDYDMYELAESEKDTDVPPESKLKASARETTILGLYYNRTYTLPMGAYIYTQDEDEVQVYPEREKIALSQFDDDTGHTIYQLYMVYAGLLRSCRNVTLDIQDSVTGEIIYSKDYKYIGKSYAGGGSNRGALIALDLDPTEWNMQSNATYYVSIHGYLDYDDPASEDMATLAQINIDSDSVSWNDYLSSKIKATYSGEGKLTTTKLNTLLAELKKDKTGKLDEYKHSYITNFESIYHETRRETFDFQFTIDYEEPKLVDYRIRYESYTDKKVVKYKIFMDVDVYDNQYVQAVLPCYVEQSAGERVLRLLTEYPIPVMSQKGEVTTVSFEITDIYDKYVKTGNMYIEVEDYALNSCNYNIIVGTSDMGADAKKYPDSVTFLTDDSLRVTGQGTNADESTYDIYELVTTPYTLYKLNVVTNPANTLIQNLTWKGAMSHVRANAGEIYTTSNVREGVDGSVSLENELGKVYAKVNVCIEGESSKGMPQLESIKLGAQLNKDGYMVSLDGVLPSIKLNPNQTLVLDWTVTPWYCDKPEVTWRSTNSQVAVIDNAGKLVALNEGNCQVTMEIKGNDRLKKTVVIEVGDPFYISNFTLYECYAVGDVVVPSDRNIMYLNDKCFKENTKITKLELPSTLTEIPKEAFKNCTNLEEVIIPGQCTAIKQNAFEGCTSLKKITFGMYVDVDHKFTGDGYFGTVSIGRNAFKDCVSLDTIENQQRLTTLYEGAFENCSSLVSLDLSELRVASNGVFRNCTSLQNITTSAHTVFGPYMFENCTAIENFVFKGEAVPTGAFMGCTSLENVTFTDNLASIGANAFSGTAVTNLTLPNGRIALSAGAFSACYDLETVTLSSGTEFVQTNNTPFAGCVNFTSFAIDGVNPNYKVKSGLLVDSSEQTLIAAPYGIASVDLAALGITALGDAALAGVRLTGSLDLTGIALNDYALAGTNLTEVTLPSGLTAIPKGLLKGSSNLTTVNGDFSLVTTIGAEAFAYCPRLSSVSMPAVVTVGNSAFESTPITVTPSSIIESVGANAFASSSIVNVNLPNLTNIGAMAFANISALKSVSVGAVERMGMGAFTGSQNIENVTFASGTKVIGDRAFYAELPVMTEITITLPTNAEGNIEIGNYAFTNLAKLENINLASVKNVGDYAFYNCASLNANLSTLVNIGAMAFVNSALENITLSSVENIGAYAFAKCESLESVTLGNSLKVIGDYAFSETSLTTVEIPAGMNSRTYDCYFNKLDEKYRVEEIKVRKEASYGVGAFAGIDTLESITVASGNEAFVSIDGVLYSRVDNGLVLEQYPTHRAGASYKVADGTVMIRDSAFESVGGQLVEVEMPYSVKMIGSYAFFDTEIKHYIFNSVDAPRLGARRIDPYDFQVEALSSIFLRGTGAVGCTNFYANFYSYAVLVDGLYAQSGDSVFTPTEFDLAMTIPLNGRGYDNIWKVFFKTIEHTDQILADDTTHAAIAAIAKLPSVETINTLSYDDINEDSNVGKLARSARVAYNKVTDSAQKALIISEAATLKSVEQAIRARKAALGHTVYVRSLVLSKYPSKILYKPGESFDATGMVLTAIYEDGSEDELVGGNYTVSPSAVAENTEFLVLSYVENGRTLTVNVYINIDKEEAPVVDPSNPEKPENKGGLDKGAVIAISVVIPVVVIVAATVAVVLVLLKKKKGVKNADVKENESNSSEENAVTEEVVETEEPQQSYEVAEEVVEDVVEDVVEADEAQQSNEATEEVVEEGEPQQSDEVTGEE